MRPDMLCCLQEGEDSVPPSGTSDGEYRGLAVSQAEAVLEPPQPPPVIPQQHAGGLDLHSSLQPQVCIQTAEDCLPRIQLFATQYAGSHPMGP